MMLLHLSWLVVCLNLAESKNLIVIGGGTGSSNRVWDKIIELAGGSNARIGVVSAASSTPEESADYYVDLFLSKGVAHAEWIPVHVGDIEANSDPDVVELALSMTGFHFSGGDQSRIIASFFNEGREDSPVMAAIRATYEAGAVTSGDSAGAACMGKPPMITGGYSWESCVYGAYEMDDPDMPDYTVQYDPLGGIGFIQDFIVDSHYGDRGREGRLMRLVADTRSSSIGTNYAIGLDEATSLVITDVDTPQAYGEVIGPTVGYAGIMLLDLTNAEEQGDQSCWHMAGISTHYLTEGDHVELPTFTVIPASYKRSIIGNEYYSSAQTSKDIFYGHGGDYYERSEYNYVACRLMDCEETDTVGTTKENNPEYEVHFNQSETTQAWGGLSTYVDLFLISYQDLPVGIRTKKSDEDKC